MSAKKMAITDIPIEGGQKKKLLYEVSIIRPTIIFLLVVLHAFAHADRWIHGGGVVYLNDYQNVTAYWWFCKLISGFRIETIALVAGYVFAYQSLDLKRSYQFWPFVVKKFKRLIIPMLFFGVLYYFCYIYPVTGFSINDFMSRLFSGCGHLWFLPMLFWCFLTIWFIDKFRLSSWLTLLLLAGISIIPIPSLPLGLTRLPHFVFYVYAGYFLWTKRDNLFAHCLKYNYIILFWLLYIILVIVKNALLPETSAGMPSLEKIIVHGAAGTTKLLMSCFGIMALYLTVYKTTTKEGYRPKQWVINASNDCYGVYVYHQFILMFLYYYTPFVSMCGRYWVPWIGLLLALGISLLLTKLTLKTKFGRFLIG